MPNNTEHPQPRGNRSLRVRPDCIVKVKAAVKRKGYARQRDLAEELGLSLATLSNFLNGKPVDCLNFTEVCDRLGLEWKDISLDPAVDHAKGTDFAPEPVVVAIEETSADIYVERPQQEQACYRALTQMGALIRLQAPSQMGKTSLMRRVKQQLASKGNRVAYISLHMAEQADFKNLNRLLKWFCLSVGQALGLHNRLRELWDEEHSTPKVNCAGYFEQCFWGQTKTPPILFLDDLELVFPYEETAAEFLGLLRAWHEKSKIDQPWQGFRMCLAYATEIQIALNFNESPFNVGESIELPEFTPTQVQELAEGYGLSWAEAEVTQLMDWVGGHPYLVKQAVVYLRQHPEYPLVDLLQTATLDNSIYHNHLRWLWRIVQQKQELHEYLEAIAQSDQPASLSGTQAWQLYKLGLVHRQNDRVQVRNRLYREYFSQQLRG